LPKAARKLAGYFASIIGGTVHRASIGESYSDVQCFLDSLDPAMDIDWLLAENGPGVTGLAAKSCVDMLADEEERNKIAGGRKIYWLAPWWVVYWKAIFRNWEEGLAN
jgi:hypothetical protein